MFPFANNNVHRHALFCGRLLRIKNKSTTFITKINEYLYIFIHRQPAQAVRAIGTVTKGEKWVQRRESKNANFIMGLTARFYSTSCSTGIINFCICRKKVESDTSTLPPSPSLASHENWLRKSSYSSLSAATGPAGENVKGMQANKKHTWCEIRR